MPARSALESGNTGYPSTTGLNNVASRAAACSRPSEPDAPAHFPGSLRVCRRVVLDLVKWRQLI